MLTDAKIEQLIRDSESHGAAWISKETLAALLDERKLLLAVAEAAENLGRSPTPCYRYEDQETLKEALAAWRVARDGVSAAGGAGKVTGRPRCRYCGGPVDNEGDVHAGG